MRQLVREHVHRQSGHADVRLATMDALFGRMRVDAAMRLLVPGQIRRGRILFAWKEKENARINGGLRLVIRVISQKRLLSRWCIYQFKF